MNFMLFYYLKKIFKNFFKIKILKKNMLKFELKISKKELYNLFFFLKSNNFFNFKKLLDLCVVDNLNFKNRFKIYYILESYSFNFLLYISLITNEILPLYSITSFYKNASWLEREMWDLFGIYFLYNFDLRRLLLDYGSEIHPLKKDFPLTGFKEVFYSEKKKKVIFLKLELMQEYRYFNFLKN